jgi:hypothetical protein
MWSHRINRRFRDVYCLLPQGHHPDDLDISSETPAYFHEITQRNIPEGCHLFTDRCESLKSQYISQQRN